jgi:hypothetical protein
LQEEQKLVYGDQIFLRRKSGGDVGNYAPFVLSGPAKQEVLVKLKVDTGASVPTTDVFLTPELAAELGLGEPLEHDGGVKGAARKPIPSVDYPTLVLRAIVASHAMPQLVYL